jgi:hypothetical protein
VLFKWEKKKTKKERRKTEPNEMKSRLNVEILALEII